MTRSTALGLTATWAITVVVAVHFFDFPGSVPRFASESGGGDLFDVSPASTVDATYQRLASYGEAGRRSYAFRNVTVDVLLPMSLLPFLFLLMRNAIAPLRLAATARLVLLALPFAYVLFDLVENALVLTLLANFPSRVSAVAEVLPVVTLVKRAASVAAIVGPIAVFGVRLLRPKFWSSTLPDPEPKP